MKKCCHFFVKIKNGIFVLTKTYKNFDNNDNQRLRLFLSKSLSKSKNQNDNKNKIVYVLKSMSYILKRQKNVLSKYFQVCDFNTK